LGVGATVVLTVLITPLFLMHDGADLTYPRGQTVTALVDEDTKLAFPVAPPVAAD
jgi:hypothetical protein